MQQKKSEDAIQAECFKWLWNTYPKTRRLYFSIPLGGLRTPSGAALLQATGAVKGTPDTCLAISSKLDGIKVNALYIEFKTDKGVLSPEQVASHLTLRNAWNGVVVVRSLEEFKKVINDYLGWTEYLS
jgi:hypothetical protein